MKNITNKDVVKKILKEITVEMSEFNMQMLRENFIVKDYKLFEILENEFKFKSLDDFLIKNSYYFFEKEDLIVGKEKIKRYKNGMIKKRGKKVNGKKEGVWMTFYENGFLSAIGKYINDKKEGEWQYYWDSGQLNKKVRYIEDKSID